MRCMDGNFYVVKFQNNPQHKRVLANAWIGTRLAGWLGLSVPTTSIVEVHPWLIECTSQLRLEVAGKAYKPLSGLCFGSRYVVSSGQGEVQDFWRKTPWREFAICASSTESWLSTSGPATPMAGRLPFGDRLGSKGSAPPS
jgi:hypothetical protein